MDGENHVFASAQERTEAIHDAEALSRKAESEANVLRGRVSRSSDPAGHRDALQEKIDAGQKAQEELDRINAKGTQADLSGMSRGLSDSAGNFAANAEVLGAGGIGVDASNTNVSTGEPTLTAAEAGTGGTGVILDDWRALPVGERRALVVSLGRHSRRAAHKLAGEYHYFMADEGVEHYRRREVFAFGASIG